MAVGNPVLWTPGLASRVLAGELKVVVARFVREARHGRGGKAPRAGGSANQPIGGGSTVSSGGASRELLAKEMAGAGVRCWVSDSRGSRSRMEDRHCLFTSMSNNQPWAVMAVFDGHNGLEAAEVASQNLRPCVERAREQHADAKAVLRSVIGELEQTVCAAMLVAGCEAGCTAVVCVVEGETLYVANVGDSRVVLSRNGKPVAVTRDHRASEPDEAMRIAASGARVIDGYVEGLIGVSRALGDVQVVSGHKLNGLSGALRALCRRARWQLTCARGAAEPDVYEVGVAGDEFLVVACDGLWDFISMDGALECVRRVLRVSSGDWRRAADDLVTLALQRSDDNVTVILCAFDNRKPFWERAAMLSSAGSGPSVHQRPRIDSSGLQALAGLLR